ncbi:hypothetical protein ALI144C_52825 [Actinosynnema sp. ALI-1.44]|nr:hypothetical protein ALI144C_52825 [Actinosynnema sp. ALI-1.44]
MLRPPVEPKQYTSVRFTESLALQGLTASIGSVGDAYDNALAESIIGLFKTEVVIQHGLFTTLAEVEFAVMEWSTGTTTPACTPDWTTSPRPNTKPSTTLNNHHADRRWSNPEAGPKSVTVQPRTTNRSDTDPTRAPTPTPRSGPVAAEQRTDRTAQRTRTRHRAIHDLLDQGMGIRATAAHLKLARGTVRRFARASDPDQLLGAQRETRSWCREKLLGGYPGLRISEVCEACPGHEAPVLAAAGAVGPANGDIAVVLCHVSPQECGAERDPGVGLQGIWRSGVPGTYVLEEPGSVWAQRRVVEDCGTSVTLDVPCAVGETIDARTVAVPYCHVFVDS